MTNNVVVPIENVPVHMAFPSKTSVRTLAGQTMCPCLQKMCMFTYMAFPSKTSVRTLAGQTMCPCLRACSHGISFHLLATGHWQDKRCVRAYRKCACSHGISFHLLAAGQMMCPCLQKMCMLTWHFLPSVSSRTQAG